MDLHDQTTIQSLLKKHNLYAKKSLGQNFLIDKSVLEKIVETANISASDHVIEIGPGLGVLTKELSKKAEKVTSVELDKNLIPVLQETLKENKNIEIINQNALNFIPPKTPYKIVANIPYYITSPLINHFLRSENPPESMILLTQKEVAEKICTLDPKMTVLSLQVALFAKAKYIETVPASSFHPQPKVESAILKITKLSPSDPDKIPQDKALAVLKLAKQAFLQRRKKLRNTLPQIEKTNIDPDRRPETLSIKEWQQVLKVS